MKEKEEHAASGVEKRRVVELAASQKRMHGLLDMKESLLNIAREEFRSMDGITQALRNVFGGMDFSQALKALKDGKKVRRAGWNGKGMWLALQRPDAKSKMTAPYIYMKTAQNTLVPWLASQTDLLAEDWRLVLEDDETPKEKAENHEDGHFL